MESLWNWFTGSEGSIDSSSNNTGGSNNRPPNHQNLRLDQHGSRNPSFHPGARDHIRAIIPHRFFDGYMILSLLTCFVLAST